MISETVLEDHIEFYSDTLRRETVSTCITVMGVVNYMISDKVLGHIAEKPVQHILTVIPTGPVNPVYSIICDTDELG